MVEGSDYVCYTPATKTGEKTLVRTITIAAQFALFGIGVGRWLNMDIIAVTLIAIAIALTPVSIWGDKWLAKIKNWLRERMNKEYAWLFNLASQQLADMGNYQSTIIHTIDYTRLASNHLIKINVELLNLTVYTLDIEWAKINAECAGYELGKETKYDDDDFERIVRGQRRSFELEYEITNKEFLNYLKEESQKNS